MAAKRRKKPYQLGKDARKIEPKLRMVANGDERVNAVRSERCPAVALASAAIAASQPPSFVRAARTAGSRKTRRGSLSQPPSTVLVNVFLSTDSLQQLPKHLLTETGRVGTQATATITLAALKQLSQHQTVRSISMGQGLKDPNPDVSASTANEPSDMQRRVGSSKLHKDGSGVLVGIIDVHGFDFAHPDFLDAKGRTRFVEIWDQGAVPDSTAPAPFNYGRIITKTLMDDAIKAAPEVGAPAAELEPQSRRQPRSHGTHVASIAAGNLGVARHAKIAAVLVSLGPKDNDPRLSFYDSTKIAHAVQYLISLGEKLKCPVAINISLGTNGHAHDDSAPVNRWIDHLLVEHGRCVCVATGNSGQEKALRQDDLGYVFGRIHTSGRVASAGLDEDIDWIVAGRDGQDFSENELEIWFSAQDRLAVSVRAPNGTWIGPIEPLQFIENRQFADNTFISVYNELYHAANGCNYIGVYLSPNLKSTPIKGVATGTWTVRIHGREIRDGRYDGWIERDDPRQLPPGPGQATPLAFPSFFSERSNVDRSSISTLACGQRIIAVANLDEPSERMNISSSEGPTRDGRTKPDVAAPGTDIVAASGFTGESQRWVPMTGTSMASPYVCGVAALMLATNKNLSAAQIAGIMQRTSRPLPGHDYAWRKDAGFGKVDAEACVKEADLINQRLDKT